MQIGGYQIDPVIDGEGRFRPTKTFRGTTEEQWLAHQDLLDQDGLLAFVMGGFLVRGHDRTILVDLGLGPATLMGITGGRMMESLQAHGVSPEDVTDVLFTHLHEDHIGWASMDGVPQFSNATFHCGAADYEHFVVEHNEQYANVKLGPCENRFETYEQAPSLPGISTLEAPGHTPGSTVIVVSEGGDRAMMLGDVVHCPVQLVDDEWDALFDFDPVMARRTRTRLARELAGDTSAVLSGAHFPGMRFGRLLQGQGRRQWVI
jgi:glyoxylase-like metal-dependent hydrolase (beta-lactamase superfamily II)